MRAHFGAAFLRNDRKWRNAVPGANPERSAMGRGPEFMRSACPRRRRFWGEIGASDYCWGRGTKSLSDWKKWSPGPQSDDIAHLMQLSCSWVKKETGRKVAKKTIKASTWAVVLELVGGRPNLCQIVFSIIRGKWLGDGRGSPTEFAEWRGRIKPQKVHLHSSLSLFYGCTEQLYYNDLFTAEPSFFIDVLCKTKQSALVTKFLPCVGP